tara:strand:+ start:819 stop:1238 length:420 start_codon:yes stop_codon:yes gene_type:complete
MKFKSNFSFARMLKRAESKTFQKKTSEFVINPMVKESKEFIKSNKVTPATTTKTLEKRRKRKTPKSIGGNTTLYDTGTLYKSLKRSKSVPYGIDMVDYGEKHLSLPVGNPRNFLTLSEKSENEANKKLVDNLVEASMTK